MSAYVQCVLDVVEVKRQRVVDAMVYPKEKNGNSIDDNYQRIYEVQAAGALGHVCIDV